MEEIQNKFLCYQTEATFKTELAAGGIGDTSIVFVLDKQYIYSHGQYFYCGFSSEVQRILTAAITELERAIKEDQIATATVLNAMRNQIENLQEQINKLTTS